MSETGRQTPWRIRDFHPDDAEGILHLWEELRSGGVEPVYGLSEVLASCQADHAVVAIHDEQVIGAAVGRAPLGLAKLSVLLPETQVRVDAFKGQGFVGKKNLHYFERRIPVQRNELGPLSELGGRVLPRGLWDAIGGMRQEKELLERKLIGPLANSELAERFGVVPPSAVVLFGPPGTGKTTFARAIASRLEWSFVEVFPSRLGSDPAGLAAGLRETFLKIAELEHAVVFIDEVEEIAGHRGGRPPAATQGVTNELLKVIPTFRDQPNRLLICATNFIRALDAAFLRHGRFDYVIPIGLPDADARASIWSKYIPAPSLEDVDVPELVRRSEGFSPADIEYAAQRASQNALEAVMYGGPGLTVPRGVTTADYLEAADATRATVSREVVAEFLLDIENIARL